MGDENTVVFDSIKNAVGNISKVHYSDTNRETRVKCDASHNGLGATSEQQTDEGSRIPISFASRYLNIQEKNYSANELELLAVVWAVDRCNHYLLSKLFIIATDHKALTSALVLNKLNKKYQSRLTRLNDYCSINLKQFTFQERSSEKSISYRKILIKILGPNQKQTKNLL